MQDRHVYDEGSEVTVRKGAVHVHGPDGVDVSLTPDAAEMISDQLLEGAMRARGERYFDRQEGRLND